MDDTSYKKLLTVNGTEVGRGLVSSSLELLSLSSTTSYEFNDLSAGLPSDESQWTAEGRKVTTSFGQTLATWTRQMLRSLRLLLFMAVGPWKRKKEQPKIALYTGWPSVLTGLLIHVLPLTACIALIYLNLMTHFVGVHIYFVAFQFLVKVLELLAPASVASAIFVYLRALYTGPESVPFGALFAGLQITKLSYLWSLKFVFLFLVPLSVILAAVIGPSIAIALTPTLGYFDSGWAVAWINATDEQLFLSNIDPTVMVYNFSSDCSTGDCAKYGWESAMTIAQLSQPWQDAMPNIELRWNTSTPYYPDVLSVTATIPNKVIAWSLNQLAQQSYFLTVGSGCDKNITTISRQPIVTTTCTEATWLNSTSVYTYISAREQEYIYMVQSEALRGFNETNTLEWAFINFNHSVTQDSAQVEPSIWIFVRYPPNANSSHVGPFGLCAIRAGYAQVQNKVSITPDSLAVNNRTISSETNIASASTITIPAIWLNRTLPSLDILLSNGFPDVDIATFLATSLAISMAQWPKQILKYPQDNFRSVQGLDIGIDPGIIVGSPQNQTESLNTALQPLGSTPGDHVLFPGSDYADAEGKYRLRWDISSQAYGYHIDQTVKILAVSVLAAYCLYISFFVVLMLTLNRVQSNAWDSIGELTALAIMSRPDDRLRNTSAGIETVAVFKLPMNIRANENNHLEIVFKDGSETSDSKIVEKNKKYN